MGERVTDPLIELLAIKLYEHDRKIWPPKYAVAWLERSEEDREVYRQIARGETPLV